MKRTVSLLLTALLFAALAFGATGVPFLTGGTGSRSIGMGRSFTGVADSPETAFYNVSGAAFFENNIGFITYVSFDPGDGADSQKEEAAALFLPVKSLYGVLGFNVLYVGYGKFTETSQTGQVLGEFSAYEIAAGISYSTRLFKGMGVGVNVKFINSHLYDDYTGNSVAFDVSMLYRKSLEMNSDTSLLLRGGISLQNIGPAITYQDSEQSDDLPRYLRTGVSGRLDLERLNGSILISAGADFDTVDKPSEKYTVHTGCEIEYQEMIYLRSGYFKDNYYENDGFNWGVGFKYANFSLDYSRDSLNQISADSINVFSLGVMF